MNSHLAEELARAGLNEAAAADLAGVVDKTLAELGPAQAWRRLSRHGLSSYPFPIHLAVFDAVYADWDHRAGPPPGWIPNDTDVNEAAVTALARQHGCDGYAALHAWSVSHRADFWRAVIQRLGVVFTELPDRIVAGDDPEAPGWLPGARLNIVDSCFAAPPATKAIVYRAEGRLQEMSYGDLELLTNRFASGFVAAGFSGGDRVAIVMEMTPLSVAAYLGTIRAGGVVVSIADSFAPDEIAVRLNATGPVAVVTQSHIVRAGKRLPMLEKVKKAGAPSAIVIPVDGETGELRPGDMLWDEFLSEAKFDSRPAAPADPTNILFSSGTTGEPKAIPWTHTTPIKAAMDGHFHQDVSPGDVVAWPTNLGWMMGPWLIYASLMNRAAMALFDDTPTGPEFGRFVQEAGVTVLGVVPSLVAAWRTSGCMEALDWSRIRAFSSTGESSNRDDMLYLMSLAGYKPVIEYCGGTEIGGSYITGTVVQNAAPATFSTPALGLDLYLLGDDGTEAQQGEVFLVPPSIGLSTKLLNADHHQVYYGDLPPGPGGVPLRRHGDHMEALGGGYFRAHGRADDTMNLGGIKVSSLEIERALIGVEGVRESAAVAVPPPGGGPSRLVVFAVLKGSLPADDDNGGGAVKEEIRLMMQQRVREMLNPLFKIHDVVLVDELPRTASNKIMRRALRTAYFPNEESV